MYGPSLGACILSCLTPGSSHLMGGAEDTGSWPSGDQHGPLPWFPTPSTQTTGEDGVSPFNPGKLADTASSAPPQSQRSPTWMQKPPPSQLPEVPGSNPSSSGKHPSSWAGLGCGLQRGKISIQGSGPPEHFPSWYSFFLHSSLAETGNRQSHNTCSPRFLSLALWHDRRGPKPLRPPGPSSGAPPTGGHPNRPFSSDWVGLNSQTGSRQNSLSKIRQKRVSGSESNLATCRAGIEMQT